MIILLHRSIEELEFPIRPPGDIKDPIRPVPSIDNQDRGVIGKGRLTGNLRRCFFGPKLGFEANIYTVKTQSLFFGAQLETESYQLILAARSQSLLGGQFAAWVAKLCRNRPPFVATRGNVGLN